MRRDPPGAASPLAGKCAWPGGRGRPRLAAAMRSFFKRLKEGRKYRKWLACGRPDPPPPMAKHEMLREYARRFGLRVLVESGTFRGDTVEALRREFATVHSIELAPKFHELAKQRFAGVPNVVLHQGDSGKLLAELVKKLDAPVLFWLDGHYSGGDTAQGESNCPVRQELEAIFGGMAQPFAVLIDDARCFRNPKAKDYPPVEEIEAFVAARRPDMGVEVAMDCIRLAPKC